MTATRSSGGSSTWLTGTPGTLIFIVDSKFIADYNRSMEKGITGDLRTRQRKRREATIVAAAKKLVSEKGYRNTSIEEIALTAEVGTATVYNYFGSKAELLLSVFNREVDAILKAGEKVLAAPPGGAVEAIHKLLETYFRKFVGRYDKQLLREIFVITFVEQLSVREKFLSIDYRMMRQVTELLRVIQQRGQIREEIRVDDVAAILFALVATDLMAFVVYDDMTLDFFLETLRHHIEMSFRGFAP